MASHTQGRRSHLVARSVGSLLTSQCRPRRSVFILVVVVLWSILMGWGAVYARQTAFISTSFTTLSTTSLTTTSLTTSSTAIAQLVPTSPTITDPLAPLPRPSPNPSPATQRKPALPGVDPVAPSYQLGQELYLETCGTCHLAIPPEVLPTSTWGKLLVEPRHYGVTLNLPIDPPRALMWNYLRNFSRPLLEDEIVPLQLDKSRYFWALHPDVDLPRPVKLGSCITCHPGANQFAFRGN